MVAVAEAWNVVLPDLRKGVTGVGVWSALNHSKPIVFEDGVFVLGLPHESTDLGGHLRLPLTRRLIEEEMARELGSSVTLRVIDGTTAEDWESEKKREAERRRLSEQALARAKAAVKASSSWEGVYEQLSRRYAETQNRSLPQNRARFFFEAVQIVATALQETPVTDDLAERNYARCLERIAQYTELPSALVAIKVMEKSFEA